MRRDEVMDEIRAAIAYYDTRGWDWTDVVAFLSAKAVGMWPLPKHLMIVRRRR